MSLLLGNPLKFLKYVLFNYNNEQRILGVLLKYLRRIFLIFAKFIFHYIQSSVTFLPFIYTLTEEMSVKPYKCIFVYLLTLAGKTNYSCLFHPDYIRAKILKSNAIIGKNDAKGKLQTMLHSDNFKKPMNACSFGRGCSAFKVALQY